MRAHGGSRWRLMARFTIPISRGYLGHFDPASGKLLKEWASPGGVESEPYGIAITNDGNVWYSESGVTPNTLVRFDPKSETFSAKQIPSGGGVVVLCDYDAIGNSVWRRRFSQSHVSIRTEPDCWAVTKSDFAGASFDRDALMSIKETAVFDKPFVKKS